MVTAAKLVGRLLCTFSSTTNLCTLTTNLYFIFTLLTLLYFENDVLLFFSKIAGGDLLTYFTPGNTPRVSYFVFSNNRCQHWLTSLYNVLIFFSKISSGDFHSYFLTETFCYFSQKYHIYLIIYLYTHTPEDGGERRVGSIE